MVEVRGGGMFNEAVREFSGFNNTWEAGYLSWLGESRMCYFIDTSLWLKSRNS